MSFLLSPRIFLVDLPTLEDLKRIKICNSFSSLSITNCTFDIYSSKVTLALGIVDAEFSSLVSAGLWSQELS